MKYVVFALLLVGGIYLLVTPSGKGFYKEGDKKMEPGIRAAGGAMAGCALVFLITQLIK